MTALIEQSPPWLRDRNRFADSDTQVSPFVPPADLFVTEEGVNVYMDIPGVHADALDVELENDTLTVRGERRTAGWCPGIRQNTHPPVSTASA